MKYEGVLGEVVKKERVLFVSCCKEGKLSVLP